MGLVYQSKRYISGILFIHYLFIVIFSIFLCLCLFLKEDLLKLSVMPLSNLKRRSVLNC